MKKTDQFANKFYGTVTESGANTLTFGQINTAISIFAKQAWIIHALEWYISIANLANLVETADSLNCALVSSDKINALGLDNPAVIDLLKIQLLLRSSVGYSFEDMPIRRSFNDMPGGGIVVAPQSLFVAAQGVAANGACTVAVRGYFTQIDLSADEYIELVDFYRIVQ